MKEHETVVQLSIPADAQFIDVARLTLYGWPPRWGFPMKRLKI
ncbi:Anti-sigma B factor [Geobacillus sp. WSUCF1]|nr:Anti-sigma B factor [Geobacillus sp. WSUCF1]